MFGRLVVVVWSFGRLVCAVGRTSGGEVLQLIREARGILAAEPSLLELHGNAKLFGDLHGLRVRACVFM